MLNKSYSYLVPLVNEYCNIDKDYFLLLDNTYVKHIDYPDEKLFTVSYNFIDNDMFLEYIDGFRANELHKETYIDSENVSVTLYFPYEYTNEYNMYINGAFSKFPESSKEIILKYILNANKPQDANRVRAVLYKDSALRKSLEERLGMDIDHSIELSSRPNMVNETFVVIKDGQYN